MRSDFSAARLHLDRAYHYLRGNDEASRKMCEKLDVLLESVIAAEFAKPTAQVVQLSPQQIGGVRRRARE
ncbi:hypothetical protein [Mesorhizobium sp. IMUNJ 23232]|uniref:hypothetical protein n=1 Tax=Mesorhizobium sp. IMUNJ 23232 TaxID=3376064 RepID=UPI0037990667